jgi:hypothetical protein
MILHNSRTQKSLKPLVIPSCALLQPTTCYTLYSTAPHPPRESLVRRGWRKAATLVSAFMTGTKSLYKDVKVMYELKRRHRLIITGLAPREVGPGTTDLVFTRAEMQFICQTQRDLRKMLPTIILFFIPFFGYFVPFIVFMYPQHMLSHHFLTEQQKLLFLAATTKIRVQSLQGLLSSEYCQDSSVQWRQLKAYISDVGREEVGSDSQDMTDDLKHVRGHHLENLCGMWRVSGGILSRLMPGLRAPSLRLKLQSHLHYIYTTDWLVNLEGGLSHLQKKDLEKLCMERCLLTGEQGDMEEYLHRWIHISTQFRECPLYLMAHLPLLLSSSEP